jgi:hypothetical protein
MNKPLSAWEMTVEKSRYHFDNDKMDPLFDSVTYLGNIIPCWQEELDTIIKQSRGATWRTRGKDFIAGRPESELNAEDYDMERAGYGKDYEISNLSYELSPLLERISNLFGLEDNIPRLHVQIPGQVWNLHIDKLEKWCPEDPTKITRIFIALTDWEQGQFWNFGNHMHSGWKAGDVTTFDWINVPHATANASFTPRVTLQLTGLVTPDTTNFLRILRSKSPYQVPGTR